MRFSCTEKKSGSILNFTGAKNLAKSSDALELECDILIPAALENVIHGGNAHNVKSKNNWRSCEWAAYP